MVRISLRSRLLLTRIFHSRRTYGPYFSEISCFLAYLRSEFGVARRRTYGSSYGGHDASHRRSAPWFKRRDRARLDLHPDPKRLGNSDSRALFLPSSEKDLRSPRPETRKRPAEVGPKPEAMGARTVFGVVGSWYSSRKPRNKFRGWGCPRLRRLAFSGRPGGWLRADHGKVCRTS